MALHDFVCTTCGYRALDVDIPIAIGAVKGSPACPACFAPMSWIPQVGRMDALEPFHQFTVEEEVRGQTVTRSIGSLHDLRTAEREHEQLARNGEGRPLVWRDYSNNASNADVHTLSATPADPHGVADAIAAHAARQAARSPGTPLARRGAVVSRDHGKVE
jgi:hypothetical protein